MYPVIDKQKCTACRNCVEICPSEVYEIEGGQAVPVRPEDCIECWACVNQCPEEAVHLSED
jgi:NAD-dependent dihydropyrimidine dehydrogenase PreA subunit